MLNPDTCPTVRVVSPEAPDGYVVINESDLTDEHQLFDEPADAPKRRGRPPKVAENGTD